MAERIGEVGEFCVERSGLEPGMEVLDVACGTGNATIPAARAGARVTGLDSHPDLLATARERAADAMVEVDWVLGDVQEMPFADDSFDRVLSTFGHMFAPDQQRTAREMKRVTRPDGRIVTCSWTPEGAVGRMLRTLGATPPLAWGSEEHVSELLGDAEFERHEVEWTDESVERYADFMLEAFGPLLDAREKLGELRPAFVDFLERENLETDGTLRFRGEYLLAIARSAPARRSPPARGPRPAPRT